MASPAAGTTPPSPIRPARPAGRLGSEEFNSSTLPTAQEAAVLYAANHPEAAANVLKAEIKDSVGRNNKQAWLMLFDLHQVAQNKQEFESLSMLFTVKFEQSPPGWADNAESPTIRAAPKAANARISSRSSPTRRVSSPERSRSCARSRNPRARSASKCPR